MMNCEIERLKSEIDTLVSLMKSNNDRMEELLEDEKVKEFVDLFNSNMSVSKLLEKKKYDKQMKINVKGDNYVIRS